MIVHCVLIIVTTYSSDYIFCWQRPSVMFIDEAYFFNNGSCFVYDYHRYGTLLV